MAERKQKLYLRFKADESYQAIVGPYLRNHPQDNNERRAIHEHSSYPLDRIESRAEGEVEQVLSQNRVDANATGK